ncbi:MAG: chitobiase/beta-hexosaminidase C-terminal domain-containing protein [Lachnospiraceae bacterium]|nr:chitobiase/beta-hexosaminidase C-terminal domain-containing protein [Lachnospiraceae bacterium]
MKCPNCSNEMKEGQLICEACGNEIRIVPDFEPEIENSITETLSTLAALQDDETTGSDKDKENNKKEKEIEKKKIEQSRKMGTMIGIIISAVLIVALFSYMLYSYHVGSVSYQMDRAREYAAHGEYEQAIACLNIAYNKDDTDPQILFLKADYYYLLFDNDSALQELKQIIDKGTYSYETVEEAYDKMVAIYSQEDRYEDINELLLNCKEDTIVNMFQSYLAKEPEFSYVEGNYDEVIPLKLSSNTSGTIYYTSDGSIPDENSKVYTAPLFLESGDYTISAVFVNDYGIKSEVVSKFYHISLETPDAPEVSLYSGEYTEPMLVSVTADPGCDIYYTTDGTEPTKDSVPYTGPIPMPLGVTHFKFVSISEEGVAGDVTMRTYILKLEGAVSTDDAVDELIDRLVETGYLEDKSGNVPQQNVTYSYQFSSVVSIDDEVYFTINEYFDDGTGILSRTDKVFLVQVYTKAVARLGYGENGEFVAHIL